MKTADEVFSKEFKDMMYERKSMSGFFNLVDIPVPDISLKTNLGRGEVCLVKDIKELFFDKLNDTEVQLVTTPVLMKRQILSNGSFRVDKDGNYVLTQVYVKDGFVAVHCNKSIGLRNKIVVNGIEKKHIPTEGFKYVDFFELNDEIRYIYIIPKENLYQLSLCALIIKAKKHDDFYKGCRIAMQNGHYLYLYVIPYKSGKQIKGSRILGVKASTNFDSEVNKLLDYWIKSGVIFDLNLTALKNQVAGEKNVGIVDLIGTLGPESFIKVSNNSLGYVPPVNINQ